VSKIGERGTEMSPSPPLKKRSTFDAKGKKLRKRSKNSTSKKKGTRFREKKGG